MKVLKMYFKCFFLGKSKTFYDWSERVALNILSPNSARELFLSWPSYKRGVRAGLKLRPSERVMQTLKASGSEHVCLLVTLSSGKHTALWDLLRWHCEGGRSMPLAPSSFAAMCLWSCSSYWQFSDSSFPDYHEQKLLWWPGTQLFWNTSLVFLKILKQINHFLFVTMSTVLLFCASTLSHPRGTFKIIAIK